MRLFKFIDLLEKGLETLHDELFAARLNKELTLNNTNVRSNRSVRRRVRRAVVVIKNLIKWTSKQITRLQNSLDNCLIPQEQSWAESYDYKNVNKTTTVWIDENNHKYPTFLAENAVMDERSYRFLTRKGGVTNA